MVAVVLGVVKKQKLLTVQLSQMSRKCLEKVVYFLHVYVKTTGSLRFAKSTMLMSTRSANNFTLGFHTFIVGIPCG